MIVHDAVLLHMCTAQCILLQVAETDQMTYVGTNYDDNSQTSTANLCKLGSAHTHTHTYTHTHTHTHTAQHSTAHTHTHTNIVSPATNTLHSTMFIHTNVCRYYIGALDRQTGRMTVQRAELMHLRPYIPGICIYTYSDS